MCAPLPPLYRSTILRTASKPFARQKRLRKSLKRAKKIVSSSFVLRTPFLVQADHLPRSLPLLWGGGKRDTMTRNIIPGYLVASSMFQRAAGAVSKSNIISGGALEQANTSVGGVWRGSYRPPWTWSLCCSIGNEVIQQPRRIHCLPFVTNFHPLHGDRGRHKGSNLRHGFGNRLNIFFVSISRARISYCAASSLSLSLQLRKELNKLIYKFRCSSRRVVKDVVTRWKLLARLGKLSSTLPLLCLHHLPLFSPFLFFSVSVSFPSPPLSFDSRINKKVFGEIFTARKGRNGLWFFAKSGGIWNSSLSIYV